MIFLLLSARSIWSSIIFLDCKYKYRRGSYFSQNDPLAIQSFLMSNENRPSRTAGSDSRNSLLSSPFNTTMPPSVIPKVPSVTMLLFCSSSWNCS